MMHLLAICVAAAATLLTPVAASAYQNGAGGTYTYYGSDSSGNARAACESKHGIGRCSTESCGHFSYWYRTAAGSSCSCGFPAGELEWVYANSGYTGVGEDFGQGTTPSVLGATELVRVKQTNACYGDAWGLRQISYPSDSSPLTNGAGGTFTPPAGDASLRARTACESANGVGACSAASCGYFSYWYRTGAGTSCSCGFPVGEYEWVYANSGYAGVGDDFGQSPSASVVGFQEFVRRKETNSCWTNAWSLTQRGYPSALVQRQNDNAAATNLAWASDFTSAKVHAKQMFLNNLTQIGSVSVLLGNWGSNTSDYVTLKIGTACGGGTGWQYWGGATVQLPAGQSTTWATIPLFLPMNVTYNASYIIEVSTQHAQLATNRNSYRWGRRVLATDALNPQHLSFGNLLAFQDSTGPKQKKQDLMFVIRGSADTATPLRPVPTTNMACPSSCILVGSSENAPGGDPSAAFNVLVREVRGLPDRTYAGGSFYSDDIPTLRAAIRSNLIEGPIGYGALDHTPPLSDWYGSRMNFYIAREDPSWDPEYLRGFMHCANIDAIVDVNTGTYLGAFSGGALEGTVGDPRTGQQRGITMHEVFGHGLGLTDQYVCWGDTCRLGTNYSRNSPDAVLLGSGSTACADPSTANWCASSLTVDQLITAMQGDQSYACWSMSPAQCGASSATCHDIRGQNIPYFGAHTCVPKSVVHYDIGIGCLPQSGCYIGIAYGGGIVALDVAQPSVPVMHSTHNVLDSHYFPGYGGAVEAQIRTMLDCFFDTTGCASYDYATCQAFQDKWDGGAPNPLNEAIFLDANACALGTNVRR
jgi:hypothetical protein